MKEDRLLEMGIIGRAHGIKGEVGLIWHGDNAPQPGDVLFLEDGQGGRSPYRTCTIRSHKGKPLAMLDGIEDRNAAEKLQGQKIFVPEKQLGKLEDDESWLADLIGSGVFLENGKKLGHLDHLEFPAGQEVWSIIDEKGREILFPAQRHFLVSFDPENREIIIKPPEGLLEIYNA